MYRRISRLWEPIVALIDSYDGFGTRGSPTSSVNDDGNRARAVKPREIAGVSRFPENRDSSRPDAAVSAELGVSPCNEKSRWPRCGQGKSATQRLDPA